MTLTVKKLGKKGRFANQMLQYAHLRQRAGEDYCCPSWIGQDVFGLTDPGMVSDATDIGTAFPIHASWYDKSLFRSMFGFSNDHRWLDLFELYFDAFSIGAGPMIGIHLRRGDYGTFRRKSARWCFRTPVEWCIRWLDRHMERFGKNAVIYIASDDVEGVRAEMNGEYAYSFNVDPLAEHAYLYDFYMLTQCDCLLISNSTFSYVASMLNTKADEFWRPRLSAGGFVSYNPWNGPVVFKDELYDAAV